MVFALVPWDRVIVSCCTSGLVPEAFIVLLILNIETSQIHDIAIINFVRNTFFCNGTIMCVLFNKLILLKLTLYLFTGEAFIFILYIFDKIFGQLWVCYNINWFKHPVNLCFTDSSYAVIPTFLDAHNILCLYVVCALCASCSM